MRRPHPAPGEHEIRPEQNLGGVVQLRGRSLPVDQHGGAGETIEDVELHLRQREVVREAQHVGEKVPIVQNVGADRSRQDGIVRESSP